jgi:ATP-dependent Clp protease ATP-binding subunit ClpB
VFNALLQVLDDGRLTDGQGRKLDFRNSVTIMTSNIGSNYLLEDAMADGEIKPDARDRVMATMRAVFRPEFLNRLDDIVLFKPLTEAEIERVVGADVQRPAHPAERTADDGGSNPRGAAYIAEQGFDPVHRARPLRRLIASEVETRIGRALLAGDVRDGAVIEIDYSAADLVVSYRNPT